MNLKPTIIQEEDFSDQIQPRTGFYQLATNLIGRLTRDSNQEKNPSFRVGI